MLTTTLKSMQNYSQSQGGFFKKAKHGKFGEIHVSFEFPLSMLLYITVNKILGVDRSTFIHPILVLILLLYRFQKVPS